MTTDVEPASIPVSAPAAPPRRRIFSGIQPSGIVHLGNDLGAIRNYVALQAEFEAIYCIVDYHALTSLHDADVLRRGTREMAASLQQPDDLNHGLLTYPVLQAADIVIYKATTVPVGKDQAAHLELTREIVRAFNNRYGETFPEQQAVFTETPTVLGTDGVRKMSKSLGNTIEILAEPEVIRKQVMSMVTDTQRILRTDPGRPEVCNVCQLHRWFGPDWEEIQDGERTARTGCVDTKKLLAERITRHYAPARERYLELMANPAEIDGILEAGADRLRPKAEATMAEVRERMGLR